MSNLFKKNKFTNISNILPKVVEKLGLDKRLNEQALFCLWPTLLDSVYIKRTIPLYIDQNDILIVAVEDSSTAQELSFIKQKLIDKLRQISPQFGVTINGLRFDLKQFNLAKEQRLQSTANYKIVNNKNKMQELPAEQLEALTLTDAELEQISEFRLSLEKNKVHFDRSNLTDHGLITDRIATLMEKQLRLKKWHKSKNLPFCHNCHEALFEQTAKLCPSCLVRETKS